MRSEIGKNATNFVFHWTNWFVDNFLIHFCLFSILFQNFFCMFTFISAIFSELFFDFFFFLTESIFFSLYFFFSHSRGERGFSRLYDTNIRLELRGNCANWEIIRLHMKATGQWEEISQIYEKISVFVRESCSNRWEFNVRKYFMLSERKSYPTQLCSLILNTRHEEIHDGFLTLLRSTINVIFVSWPKSKFFFLLISYRRVVFFLSSAFAGGGGRRQRRWEICRMLFNSSFDSFISFSPSQATVVEEREE